MVEIRVHYTVPKLHVIEELYFCKETIPEIFTEIQKEFKNTEYDIKTYGTRMEIKYKDITHIYISCFSIKDKQEYIAA